MEEYDTNDDSTSISNKATVHDTMTKRAFDILKQQFNKTCHRNPFSKKITTRMIKSKKQIMNSMISEINNNIQQIKGSDNDPELLKQFNRLLNELKEYDKPEDPIEIQLKDLKQTDKTMGINDFEWNLNDNKIYNNQFVLELGPSRSGKSVLTNQLIGELPVSFDKLVLFMPPDSFRNTSPQILQHVCKRAGIKTQWVDTSNECLEIEYTDSEEQAFSDLNPNGSCKYIYNNPLYGSVWVIDDCYTCRSPAILNLIDEMAVKGRHSKRNIFINFQGFTKLSNKIIDNVTKIFIHQSFVGRDDIWRKLKMAPPENLQEVISDINSGFGTRWYYIDDIYLQPYTPYQYANQAQVIEKFKAKLPKNLKNEKIRKEFEQKEKELERMRKQLKITESVESLLTGNPDSDKVNESKSRTILLTDPKDATEITQKQRSQEYTIHDPRRFDNKRVRNIGAKYKL